MYKGVIDRYKSYLPISDKTPIVTLFEGNTPLLRARNLENYLGVKFQIFLKCEGFNPTGSFKDRGMTVAISKAVEERCHAVLCASTGNTAASAAAYAARAEKITSKKLKCIVLLPEKAIALGKLSQAVIHGAVVIAVKGNFDVTLDLARKITQEYPIKLVNSLNPDRIEGQKTASFEIVDSLGDAPDYNFIPVGNAGNITAYWKGYKEYFQLKKATKLPRMMGFQAEGAAPIVRGKPIKNPKTIATAIRIGNPASWEKAVQARDESGGVIDIVSDKEILQAYKLIPSLEGVFVEPASAASVAGLIKYVKNGYFKKEVKNPNLKVVCILTGHGLKDPKISFKVIPQIKTVKPDINLISKALKL